MHNKILIAIFFVALCLGLNSCEKYLSQKPDKSLTTPSTLDDLKQLLNYYDRMNASYPAAGEVCSDNYYLNDADWAATPSEYHRNLYIWQKFDDVGSDWVNPYRAIMTANVILENIDRVPINSPKEKEEASQLKGMALFVRAYYHFALSQLFMPVYNEKTSHLDLGIPLRKSADINEKVERPTSKETYHFITVDIVNALKLLPVLAAQKHLPSRAAAYGLLSRVYLSMQSYALAGRYADSALSIYNTLIDYNLINATSAAPFLQFNDEVIYDSEVSYPNIFNQARARVDTTLYNSFSADDIRRTAFFGVNINGGNYFKGNYTGKANNPSMFSGIATDELYLSRAECLSRKGDSLGALKDLNYLLQHRIQSSTFIPYELPIDGGLLNLILIERRKELMYRTLRWTDLRRLNTETKFADTLWRNINSHQYELLPNDIRYTLLIDRNTIRLSGIQQNP